MRLEALQSRFFMCRWPANAAVPAWVWEPTLIFAARTAEELSLMLPAETCQRLDAPRREGPWRGFRIAEPLNFDMVGILAQISRVLAEAGIPLLAISTFDTDYVWVPAEQWGKAVEALTEAGYQWGE